MRGIYLVTTFVWAVVFVTLLLAWQLGLIQLGLVTAYTILLRKVVK